ncbi:hypothetical protein HELRODRAFT_168201 [Helobdella robusta]|uniref:Uncharacterized protein n=1 Tax=Helobdella robusta TaxID=6412 RepID=T1F0A9_HELRO|nr:hypothetical protein HELRODRAFT_168201 [Helobdella robusta]ESO09239.1 hypothetical protein HELRODRAFT_168201 [Helobdella robusta]
MVLLLQAAFLPRLVYFLRTSPLLDVSILNSFDDHLRDAFQSIFNIKLDQKNWLQGTLPIFVGGLGLGSAAELAPSAFLASAAATVALQDLMLPRDGIYVDNFRMQIYDMWRATNGDVVALENPSQKHWIAPCLNRSVDRWLQLNGSTFDKARIMAGRSLAWDVTLPHTMADRYIGYTSVEAGTAALKASDFKNEKYVSLNNLSKIFQPICIETPHLIAQQKLGSSQLTNTNKCMLSFEKIFPEFYNNTELWNYW